MSNLVGFPREVNEKAARSVAGGVVVLAVLALVTGWRWVPVVMAIGFALRVLAGPRFSPLGQLATRVIAPRLGTPKIVPGPPKRFAQAIGFLFTTAASVAAIGFGATVVAAVLMGVLLAFALLESVVGFCAGCYVFGWLMRWGVIPADTCEACNNVQLRLAQATAR
ncbi:DUF4395 domain-containing protein [Cumulibacter manganitolerans]|uniref:DUF4395 domain-containing protein n=1 Tax=Cumulibacter manganitolerans TaxID=1884992 RepID=UPI001295D3A9|nr:DUF4395 domain-containing protein [Cumulibacter manganitolerans]